MQRYSCFKDTLYPGTAMSLLKKQRALRPDSPSREDAGAAGPGHTRPTGVPNPAKNSKGPNLFSGCVKALAPALSEH